MIQYFLTFYKQVLSMLFPIIFLSDGGHEALNQQVTPFFLSALSSDDVLVVALLLDKYK